MKILFARVDDINMYHKTQGGGDSLVMIAIFTHDTESQEEWSS